MLCSVTCFSLAWSLIFPRQRFCFLKISETDNTSKSWLHYILWRELHINNNINDNVYVHWMKICRVYVHNFLMYICIAKFTHWINKDPSPTIKLLILYWPRVQSIFLQLYYWKSEILIVSTSRFCAHFTHTALEQLVY